MNTPQDLFGFISQSPSVFHACEHIRNILSKAGYEELSEGEAWSLKPGGRYVVRRGARLIAAINLGNGDVAETGTRIIASHIDSPCLRLKRTPVGTADQHTIFNVAVYGSPLLHTWLDRDLELAGAVYVTTRDGIERRLFRSHDSVCRIASLAPHLKDPKDGTTIPIAAEHLKPIVASSDITDGLMERLLASACQDDGAKITGFDLSLADRQAPTIVGPDQDLMSSARLDNLMSAHASLAALLDAKADAVTRIALWYDSEEIGSQTVTGARSDFVETFLARLAEVVSGPGHEAAARTRANSVMMSIDMAHADNPGYPGRLDTVHTPKLNGGMAVKYPAQGNYAEDSGMTAWYEAACAHQDVPLQKFMYKTGHRGGASLGPIATTKSGIRGFDVGAGLVGMHSIRELGGARDVALTISAIGVFLAADPPPAGL